MKTLFLLAFALPTLAAPITVYTNFGPGQSYTSLGIDIGVNVPSVYASAFAPTTTAALSSITLPLYTKDSSYLNSALLTVDLRSGSQFGPSLEGFAILASSLNNFSATLITLQSLTHPNLTAGNTYYLTLLVETASQGTYSWARNIQLDKQGSQSFDGGANFTASNLISGAFEIQGDAASGVPEPSTWITFGSAAILWVALRRRAA